MPLHIVLLILCYNYYNISIVSSYLKLGTQALFPIKVDVTIPLSLCLHSESRCVNSRHRVGSVKDGSSSYYIEIASHITDWLIKESLHFYVLIQLDRTLKNRLHASAFLRITLTLKFF